MNKNILSILITFILILFSFTVNSAENTFDKYNIQSYFSDQYMLMIGSNKKELYTKTTYHNASSTEKIYTLPSNIIDYFVSDDEIYLLYHSSSSQNTIIISTVTKNNIEEKLYINSTYFSSKSKFCIDYDNTYYILGSGNFVYAYNKSGEFLYKTTDKFQKILSLNGICYGIQNQNIKLLTKNNISTSFSIDSPVLLYKISEKHLIDNYGNIYTLSGNSFKSTFKLFATNPNHLCETNKYLVHLNNKTLSAYNKITGEIMYEYHLNNTPVSLSSCKNKIAIIYKDLSYSILDENKIFKNVETTVYTANIVNDDKNSKSSNKKYKLSNSKKIYVPAGTTISQFKKQDEYKDYEITFSSAKSGVIGTNMSVTINNKTYKTIVIGDITGEGNINSRDINLMFDHLLNIQSLKSNFKIAGDMNNDNKITNADLVLLAKMID